MADSEDEVVYDLGDRGDDRPGLEDVDPDLVDDELDEDDDDDVEDALEDDVDAFDARGWGDGLPVVPPTEARVLRMLEGTDRAPDEVVGVVPPDLTPATVEKVAINAVLAGCRPEYLPVVLAAVEAACTDEFNMHGLIATTWFAGPMVVVSGPAVSGSRE